MPLSRPTAATRNARPLPDGRAHARPCARARRGHGREARHQIRAQLRSQGKDDLRKHSGYVKAKQFNRAKNIVRAMKQYLKNVSDEAEAAAKGIVPRTVREMALLEQLRGYVELSRKIVAQDKGTPGKDKVYSVHEPQVECIAKGKVHKRYEFGVKAGFVTASRTNWILGAMALPGNPYDGSTLSKVLEQAEEICGVKPQHAYCDFGYRGHGYKGDCDVQVVNRFRKRKPRALLRWWKRRSAVEPVIGHVKSDHYMERNMLGGERGDKLNAMLSAAGFNLVKLMKGLKKRLLKRLFLCLRTMAGDIADTVAGLLRWIDAAWRQAATASCRLSFAANWHFA